MDLSLPWIEPVGTRTSFTSYGKSPGVRPAGTQWTAGWLGRIAESR